MSTANTQSPLGTIWRWIGHIQHGILRVFGLIIIFVFLLSIPGCLTAMISGSQGGQSSFKLAKSGVLYFEPSGRIVEESTQFSSSDAFSSALMGGTNEKQLILRDVIEGLRAATADENVQALVIRLDSFGGATPAALHQIADELAAFRDAAKDVIAYADNYNNSSWFLAAQASEIYMHDLGAADVVGYGIYGTYYRGLLDRLNLTVNDYRVGTYKSALEPVLGNEMSEAAEEANRYLYGEIWNAYKDKASLARGMAPGDIQSYGDDMAARMVALDGNYVQLALDGGLVDEVMGRSKFYSMLKERFGTKKSGKELDASSFMGYAEHKASSAKSKSEDKIAVIYAVGMIVDGDQDGGTVGGDIHARLIRKARLDEDVKAIVLRIDSGGGSAFASELIREELEMAREAGKPVIASMGGVAASGGYWIATPANKIIAEPTTITGSIGIFGFLLTAENAMADWGVYRDGFGTTQTAGGLSVVSGVTPAQDAFFQAGIEYGYERFLSIVGEARGMTRDEVDAVAQGRVWTGTQALDRGLVDQLGNFDDAVTLAAELAELEDYSVKSFYEEVDPVEEILSALGVDVATGLIAEHGLLGTGVLADWARQTHHEIEQINMMNDPNGIYALCLGCEVYRQAQ